MLWAERGVNRQRSVARQELIGAGAGVEPTSGDVDAEVAGETGEAVGVALSDGAESPGPVSAETSKQTSAIFQCR